MENNTHKSFNWRYRNTVGGKTRLATA